MATIDLSDLLRGTKCFATMYAIGALCFFVPLRYAPRAYGLVSDPLSFDRSRHAGTNNFETRWERVGSGANND